MANKGRLTVVAVETADIEAPGDVGLSSTQVSNKAIGFVATPPTVDSDGSELTGIKKVRVGVARANEDGTSPFTDAANFDNVAEAVRDFDVNESAGELSGDLPILVLGGLHYVAAYAED